MKKKWLVFLAIVLILVNLISLFSINRPTHQNISTFISFFEHIVSYTFYGQVFLRILYHFNIVIVHPLNTTYNFTPYEDFTISLNVTANDPVDTWRYTLVKMSDDSLVYNNITFIPNTTFNAVRQSNKLIVWANNTNGSELSVEIIFYVSVPNTAPIIQNISDLLACEDTYFSYFFNVTDLDEDDITFYLQPIENPFYVRKNTTLTQGNLTVGEIFSLFLSKIWVDTYQETLWAIDGQYADYKTFNIIVIEVNHPPNIETITTKTVWVNETFYYQINATDLEDGTTWDGNLSFNLTFLSGTQFFDINETTGVMNVTPSMAHLGVYNISVCVVDPGLTNSHENLSLCNTTNDSLYSCINFSLTVTDENRPPNITSHYPESLVLTIYEEETINFDITKYDPDGTIPDSYWYLDSSSILQFQDTYSYTPGIGDAGSHQVTIEITDGELNDSITWNITVLPATIPPTPPSAGGGISTIPRCVELWACGEWGECQDLEAALQMGLIDKEIKNRINEVCLRNLWEKGECGFQIRKCTDINGCNTTFDKPPEIQACQFSKLASCSDNITNCHHGSCEILTDCGGPCPPCPTCSDGIQNQGEQGIDCEGPCPWACPEEVPLKLSKYIKYLLLLVIFLSIVIIAVRLIRIFGGGKVKKKYECLGCEYKWSIPFGGGKPKRCPKCRRTDIRRIR